LKLGNYGCTGGPRIGKQCCAGALALPYFLPGGSSSFDAILTNSASDSACIFRITWPRWIFTVISLIPSAKSYLLIEHARDDQAHDLALAVAEGLVAFRNS